MNEICINARYGTHNVYAEHVSTLNLRTAVAVETIKQEIFKCAIHIPAAL
jgi:hypothetical protein